MDFGDNSEEHHSHDSKVINYSALEAFAVMKQGRVNVLQNLGDRSPDRDEGAGAGETVQQQCHRT